MFEGLAPGREADPEVELHPSNKTVIPTSRARPFKTCLLLKVRTCSRAATLRGLKTARAVAMITTTVYVLTQVRLLQC